MLFVPAPGLQPKENKKTNYLKRKLSEKLKQLTK